MQSSNILLKTSYLSLEPEEEMPLDTTYDITLFMYSTSAYSSTT